MVANHIHTYMLVSAITVCFAFINWNYPCFYRPRRKKCPYLELFWSVFCRIWTEYGEIQSISPYSVQMRENADQNNSEYGHFLRSGQICITCIFVIMLRSCNKIPFGRWEVVAKNNRHISQRKKMVHCFQKNSWEFPLQSQSKSFQ